jgi:hypothetical protein
LPILFLMLDNRHKNMSPSTSELFSEVCRDILMTKDTFTWRDFIEHELIQEMPYKLCKKMVRNFLAAQVKLGSIKEIAPNIYSEVNYEKKNTNSKNQVRKDIQAIARSNSNLHQRHAVK